mgnify:CR=1 FL=1
MDVVRGEGRRVVWVGEPNVGNPKIQAAVTTINKVAREEAARRDWVSYFDLAKVVAGPGGGFADYVTFGDGDTVKCYAGDGVHLSMQCLDRAMDKFLPSIVRMYAPSGRLPTTSTTTSTVVPPSG